MGETICLILYTSSPNRCCQHSDVLQFNVNICDGYAKEIFTTETVYFFLLLTALRSRKKHTCHRHICEIKEKALIKIRMTFARKIFPLVEQNKYCKCSFHFFFLLLTHGYFILNNLKSIGELTMFKGKN